MAEPLCEILRSGTESTGCDSGSLRDPGSIGHKNTVLFDNLSGPRNGFVKQNRAPAGKCFGGARDSPGDKIAGSGH
ncbi:MAG: hypothetical protein CM1200mP18_08920 [Gammaproteobacteria bacterium]|nr:MAG: hypothetical protein CM1200mP18_08920 [Gammaproteobacteria bacterium]